MRPIRPAILIAGITTFVVLLILLFVNGGSRERNADPATAPTTTQAPRPGFGPYGDVLETEPETGGPSAVTLKNPQVIRRWLTDTTEQRTRDLLVELARERMRRPKTVTIAGRVYPADDGTLPLRLRGGTPARTLRVVIDTRKPGRLTIRVDGKAWKTVATDDQRAQPGGTPARPTI